MLPGRKSPYDLIFTDTGQSAKVNRYTLTIEYSVTTTIPQLLKFIQNSSYMDSINFLHVIGQIQNTGASTTYVKAIATFYNSSGGIVATSFTYTDPSSLAANQTAPFEILLSSRTNLVHSYSLTADSNEYAVVSEFSVPTILVASLIPLSILF